MYSLHRGIDTPKGLWYFDTMDIALIIPYYHTHMVIPQLGVGYLSSYLKSNGFSVKIIDALKNKLDNKQILKILKKNNIKAVGITCVTSNYDTVAQLSKFLKENDIKTIIGGVHSTFLPYRTLKDTAADFVICGEGEIALTQLVRQGFDNKGIKGVYSLADLKDETTPFERAEIVEDLDSLPFPDYEQMDPRDYPIAPQGFFVKTPPVAMVTSSRGCPYSCTFCASPAFYEKRIRFRSPKNVVNEIKWLVEEYGVREVQFADDNVTLKRAHIEEICNLLIENNIKISLCFTNGIRADKIDDELMQLMHKAGCYYVSLGIESANPQILKNIKKSETIETIEAAIDIVRRSGILCGGLFIFGLPGETKETIKETYNFIMNSKLDRLQCSILGVLPGSELWYTFQNEFVFETSKANFREPTWVPKGLTKQDLMDAQSNTMRSFYLKNRVFLKHLSLFKLSQFKYLLRRIFDYRIFQS